MRWDKMALLPKIVLDSNLNALENAANGKGLSSTAGPFLQRCIFTPPQIAEQIDAPKSRPARVC